MPDITLMIAGQSNGGQMCTLPVVGVNPVDGTYVWQSAWRPMTSSDGAGIVELTNMLRLSVGFENVYVYECCYGGSSIVPVTAVPSQNCWKIGDLPITDCLAQVAAGGKKPQMVVWVQGEQEGWYVPLNPSFDMVGNYKFYLDQLRLFLLGQWGITETLCRWMITPVGIIGNGNTSSVRQAQEQYCAATSGVFLGPARADLATLDGTHLTGPSCITFADRLALSLIAYFRDFMPDTDTLSRLTALEATDATLASIAASLTSRVGALETARAASALALSDVTLRVSILENQVNPPAPGTFGAGTFGTGNFG